MLSPTFDLSKYPTAETIRHLASLLERMTAANNQLNRAARKGDVRRASSASLLGSSPSHALSSSSPTSSSSASTAVVASSATPPPPPPPTAETYTRFHARSIPSIDIFSYLSRIFKYCPCANECFLSLLVYFDRMSKNALALTGRPFTIDSYNIHRLIIAGVMVSSKFFSDVFYTNTRYAKVGGLPVSELNSLELEFLFLNGFNLSVPISELQRYGDQLLKVGYMEQEILKSIMYDTPSYNPATHGPIRHGRSSSMGSAVLARPAIAQQQAFSPDDRKVSPDLTTEQQLVDMTARVSLDDDHRRHTYSHMSRHGSQSYAFTPQQQQQHPHQQQQQQQQQQQSYHHHLTKVPSNGSLHSSSAAMQRMASYGSLHHSPQSVVFNAPMTNQDSYHRAGTPDDDYDPNIDRRSTPFAFQQHHPRTSPPPNHNPSASSSSSTYRRPQRHSFVTGSDTWASPPPRQRHGSMGFASSPVADIWKHQQQPPHQHRLPRQSRSSVNLCQQAGFRKSTPPPIGLEQPLVTGEMASAAVYNGYYPYNGAFHNPLGIPTPPPSSSPVHHKQSMPSPYQTYQPSSQSTQPLMYL